MMGWQEQQRERYKQQQAEKARAEQQEAEQQRLLLKSQFEEQERIAAEQSAVRERQAEEKLRIEKQQRDEADQRLADGLKLLDAQRQERLRLAREKTKARKMPQAPQSRRSHGRPRKPWFRKNEIIWPLILTSFLTIAAIVFNFPKIQHFIGLDYQNVTTSQSTVTTTSSTSATSTAKNTLQSLCDAAKAEDYRTQWGLLSTTFQSTWKGGYDEFSTGLMHRDNSGGGVADCTIKNMIQNGSSGSGQVTIIFNKTNPPDTKIFLLAVDNKGVWKINDMLNP